MGSTTTQLTIINRGLQLLGYKAVSTLNINDRGARAMQVAYTPVLEACLRENFWSFSIRRAVLAASGTPPAFGKANYFNLPGDYLMLAPGDQNTSYSWGAVPAGQVPGSPYQGPAYSDWQIEGITGGGQAIATNDAGPLKIRYVSNAVTEGQFDACFSEALAAALAMDTCEQLTQSNSKLQNAEKMYDAAISLAKQRNAFEAMPVQPPVDSWILVRL